MRRNRQRQAFPSALHRALFGPLFMDGGGSFVVRRNLHMPRSFRGPSTSELRRLQRRAQPIRGPGSSEQPIAIDLADEPEVVEVKENKEPEQDAPHQEERRHSSSNNNNNGPSGRLPVNNNPDDYLANPFENNDVHGGPPPVNNPHDGYLGGGYMFGDDFPHLDNPHFWGDL